MKKAAISAASGHAQSAIKKTQDPAGRDLSKRNTNH